MKTVAITIEEWCRQAESGNRIPVEITLAGTSMQPLIRMNRDAVVIEPYDREIRIGDIVLFRRADGAYVVHRVYKISGDRIITLGDNCENPDAPIEKGQVLGRVTRIRRGSRTIDPDSPEERKRALRSMKMLPLRKKVMHLKYVVKKNQSRNVK